MNFTCAQCQEQHDLAELSFGAEAPLQWQLLSDAERARSELGHEQCVIEAEGGPHFFVRACLEIPIQNTAQSFTWGVWCSLSETSFHDMSANWDRADRISLGPYFGWLCSVIPGYPNTAFLRTLLRQRAVGERPLVEIEQSAHLLSVHQREGIGALALQQIVMDVLHEQI